MRADLFTRVLFALYCTEAGVFLCWAPWTGFWQRTFLGFTVPGVELLLLSPWIRGAISGFGLVHLVWAAHDLLTIFSGSLRSDQSHS